MEVYVGQRAPACPDQQIRQGTTKETMNSVRFSRTSIVFLSAIMMHAIPAISVLRAEDTSRTPMHLTQASQAPRKGPFLEGSQMVRPSPKEREAIYQLLALKPRPKTLKDADMKFLQGLRDKSSWFVIERRMVHEIWADVNGTEWRDTE